MEVKVEAKVESDVEVLSGKVEAKVESDVEVLSGTTGSAGHVDIFGGLTVGWITGSLKMEGCELRGTDTLGDLARVLAGADHTAMAVVGHAQKLLGLATVTDVMRAYFEGIPREAQLADWLAGGVARVPQSLLKRLCLPPSASLAEVAETMIANAIAGDCACHHVVVQDVGGRLHGVISTMDLIKGLRHYESWKHCPLLKGEEESPMTYVSEVMKPRDHVFTVAPSQTLREAVKELLMINQGSLLVVDDLSVLGVVTERDMVAAYSEGVSSGTKLDHWLFGQTPNMSDRMVGSSTALLEAANLMSARRLEHLVVRSPEGSEVVGVVSSLDVVLRSSSKAHFLKPMPRWAGPTVGEVLIQHQETYVCPGSATLAEASKLLAGSGATSMIVEIGPDASQLGLLTENGILRAYVDGFSSEASVEDWMEATEFQHSCVAAHLQVLPNMPLTEAAALMLSAAEPGRTCHHLVVRSNKGRWLGVFSALDVARALQVLPSQLDVARTCAGDIVAGDIMKLRETVPTCSLSDTVGAALGKLDRFCQNAALVEDNNDVLWLLTPRCAVNAMARSFPSSRSVAEWLAQRHVKKERRDVRAGQPLMEVAALMSDKSQHHLLVNEGLERRPIGVVSSLDVARGIASVNYHCPFVSLSWLRLFGKPSTVSETDVHIVGKETHKRRWGPELADEEFDHLAGLKQSRIEL